MDNKDFEWLTHDICKEFEERAKKIAPNGGEDTGALRELRIELQNRCNLPEVQAYNILRGIHVKGYLRQYDFLSGRVPPTEAMQKRIEEAERRRRKEDRKMDAKEAFEKVKELERQVAVLEELVNEFSDDGFGFEEND